MAESRRRQDFFLGESCRSEGGRNRQNVADGYHFAKKNLVGPLSSLSFLSLAWSPNPGLLSLSLSLALVRRRRRRLVLRGIVEPDFCKTLRGDDQQSLAPLFSQNWILQKSEIATKVKERRTNR